MPNPTARSWTDWWPLLLALAAASLLALFAAQDSPGGRVGNLDVSACPLPEVYVMAHKTEANVGYVVSRRRSTMRRGDNKQPGRRWRIHRVQGPFTRGGRDSWVLRSKVHGTLLLVPVEDVPDWGLAMVHGLLRAEAPELDLPEVAWISLFVSRAYSGLYLQIALPADVRKKDGGSGLLRVLLETDGKRTTRIDTRFEDDTGVFVGRLAVGRFPTLAAVDPRLAWLQGRSPLPTTTLLQSHTPPFAVRPLPLPIAVGPLFAAVHGRPAAHVVDDRAQGWRDALAKMAATEPFDAHQLQALKKAWPAYLSAFRHGLRLDARVRGIAEVNGAGLDARFKTTEAMAWPLSGGDEP